MIFSKLIINQVIKHFVKHFKMDRVMNYVFNDNELDKKVKELDEEVKMLIAVAHPKRDFVICEECKCKIKEKENG